MTITLSGPAEGLDQYLQNGVFENSKAAAEAITHQLLPRVREKVPGIIGPNFGRVLRRAVKNALQSGTRDDRTRNGVVSNDVIGDWAGLAKHFVYVLKSHGAREYELEMAMLVARSDSVLGSVNRGIDVLLEVIDRMYPRAELGGIAARTHKLYYTTLVDQFQFPQLLLKQRNFQESVVVLHDLLQIAWSFFDGIGHLNLPAADRPLAASILAPGIRANDKGKLDGIIAPVDTRVMFEAVAFAKRHNLPVEVGPSMTTVRFCQINELVKKTSLLGHYRQEPLSSDERKHLVWAIFAYWTIHYPKAFGSAHCFFFVNCSALQLGAELAPFGQYPELAAISRGLGANWTMGADIELDIRKEKLRKGLDQATCPTFP
jgi:hypothetical protein